MAITANSFVVAGKSDLYSPQNMREMGTAAQDAASPASAEPTNNEGNAVIVNGKRKPIGKKSAYLLDMLTLDDE